MSGECVVGGGVQGKRKLSNPFHVFIFGMSLPLSEILRKATSSSFAKKFLPSDCLETCGDLPRSSRGQHSVYIFNGAT